MALQHALRKQIALSNPLRTGHLVFNLEHTQTSGLHSTNDNKGALKVLARLQKLSACRGLAAETASTGAENTHGLSLQHAQTTSLTAPAPPAAAIPLHTLATQSARLHQKTEHSTGLLVLADGRRGCSQLEAAMLALGCCPRPLKPPRCHGLFAAPRLAPLSPNTGDFGGAPDPASTGTALRWPTSSPASQQAAADAGTGRKRGATQPSANARRPRSSLDATLSLPTYHQALADNTGCQACTMPYTSWQACTLSYPWLPGLHRHAAAWPRLQRRRDRVARQRRHGQRWRLPLRGRGRAECRQLRALVLRRAVARGRHWWLRQELHGRSSSCRGAERRRHRG